MWASILAIAAVTQGLGHTLQSASLHAQPARLVGTATLVEPPIATLAADSFFGETLTVHTAVGGATVLVAIGAALRAAP